MKRVRNQLLTYDDGLMFLDDELFTGIGFFLDAKGQLVGEIEYRCGLEWGMRREWYGPGSLSLESPMFMGVFHGKKREWHRNGQLAKEGDYELGFRLRERCWDENGVLIGEYELNECDSDYKQVEKYRDLYMDDLARERLIS